MPVEFPTRIIDIGDPRKLGMYRDFDGEIGMRLNQAIRGDGLPQKYRLVKKSESGENPWEDVNIEGAQIVFTVGLADKFPSAGTFKLTYGGDSTGLTALAFDITKADLQTALNANPAIAAGGGSVTVTKIGSYFSIQWNQVGARTALELDASGLEPQCDNDGVTVYRVGDVGSAAIQVLCLIQVAYAQQDVWETLADGGLEVQEVQAGSATKKCVRRLVFTEPAYDGTFILNFPKPQVTRITCKSNAIVKQVFTVDTVDGSALGGKYFVCADSAGAVNVWFNTGASVAPSAPVGGRNLQVTITAADTAATVGTKLATALDADAQFVAVNSGSFVTVTQASAGIRLAPVDVNTTFTINQTVEGTAGTLKGKYLILQDENGSVAVWFSVAGSAIPSGALEEARDIEVAVLDGDNAVAVATALRAALDADAAFAATRTNAVVVVTDAVGGPRDNATNGDSTLALATTTEGKAITAQVPYNAKAEDLQNALENSWLVTKTGRNFRLRSAALGVQPDFELVTDELIYPNGIQGVINLNTFQMFLAFANTEDDFLTLIFEGEITFPDQLPFTFYREPILVYRDVTKNSGAIPLPTLETLTREGTVNLSNGIMFEPVFFSSAFSAPPTSILLTLWVPSDAGEAFHVVVDASTVSTIGFTILQSQATPNVGYKVSYRAKL